MATTAISSKKTGGSPEEFSLFFRKKCFKKNLQCSRCFGPYNDPCLIKRCQHIFCRDCLSPILHISERLVCPYPLCGRPYTRKDVFRASDKQTDIIQLWDKYAHQYGIYGENPYNPIPEDFWQKKTKTPEQNSSSSERPRLLIIEALRSGYSAVDKKLGGVTAKTDIRLTDCQIEGKTRSLDKDITAKNSSLQEVIAEKGNITLTESTTKGMISSAVELHATGSTLLERAEAQGNICLCDTMFFSVISHNGHVMCHSTGNSSLTYSTGQSIWAQSHISLKQMFVAYATSHSNTIHATQTHLHSATAGGSIRLRDSLVEFSIESGQDVYLNNTTVAGKVSCKARLELSDHSRIGFLEIFFPQNGQIMILLEDNSKIEKGVIIRPPLFSPLSQCTVSIQGEGIIEGAIRFQECSGSIEMSPTIKHRGNIGF